MTISSDDYLRQAEMPQSRSVLGAKKSARLEGRVSEEHKEAVRRRWNDMGLQSESEYLEFVTAVDCYGVEHVRSLTQKRFHQVRTVSATSPTKFDWGRSWAPAQPAARTSVSYGGYFAAVR